MRGLKEYEKMSPSLLYFFLFSLIWLADYIERMGVRVCSCCGNGLLFVKGYIPGIWCFCAAIDKNPSLQGLMNGLGLLPGQAGPGREKELGGRCANRRTERWNSDREMRERGEIWRCEQCSCRAGRKEWALWGRERASACALRLLLPHLGYFLNVTHFTIKVRYVSVCVLIICLPWQDFASQWLTRALQAVKSFFKGAFHISSIFLCLYDSAFKFSLLTDAPYVLHT